MISRHTITLVSHPPSLSFFRECHTDSNKCMICSSWLHSFLMSPFQTANRVALCKCSVFVKQPHVAFNLKREKILAAALLLSLTNAVRPASPVHISDLIDPIFCFPFVVSTASHLYPALSGCTSNSLALVKHFGLSYRNRNKHMKRCSSVTGSSGKRWCL